MKYYSVILAGTGVYSVRGLGYTKGVPFQVDEKHVAYWQGLGSEIARVSEVAPVELPVEKPAPAPSTAATPPVDEVLPPGTDSEFDILPDEKEKK